MDCLIATLLSLVIVVSGVRDGYNGQHPDDCPVLCSEAGPNPVNWANLHHLSELGSCNQTVLFDFNIQGSVVDPKTVLTIRACASGPSLDHSTIDTSNLHDQKKQRGFIATEDCGAKAVKTSLTLESEPSTLNKSTSQSSHVDQAARQLASFVMTSAECGTTIIFAKHESAIVGLYSGAHITNHAASSLLTAFGDKKVAAQQICQLNNAALTLGVVSAGFDDLANAQDVVKNWSNGICVNNSIHDTMFEMKVLISTEDKGFQDGTIHKMLPPSPIPTGDCQQLEVQIGDSCASLASSSGLSLSEFLAYNPGNKLCSTLIPGQYVCRGPGKLSQVLPQAKSDGICSTYKVNPKDGCWAIADAHHIKTQDIEDFNKHTWGWAGCGSLQVGQVICISSGDPPMPAPVKGVTCGPQVPGTLPPAGGTKSGLEKLNPCPLNACCDVWGYCGTSPDFCTPTPADTGAPGTAKPGTNGCISNCGMDIVNNDHPPDEFKNIGYFEGFDQRRACLKMSAPEIPPNQYSHIHFAFATITSDFNVDISSTADQFQKFMGSKMGGTKKVLSFGGWAFSTDLDTFQRFRDATKQEHRGTFVANLVSFMNQHNLSGFDFDWEYPGAPDIPSIPPGSPDEGTNFSEFLRLLRSKLPSDKSISIAVPSSYWYLKQYPLKDIATSVDYFIFMTYDFHGQWDVDNKWSVPGCPAGNCLRSHINKTETHDAMVVITKAGIEARKVVVGITSYGRAFRMRESSCATELCTFLGDKLHSKAYAGRCTNTAGYLANGEINEIIANHGKYPLFRSYVDMASDSNILVYGTYDAADWVGYMDGSVKAGRKDWIKRLNFGGSSDWAIDLEQE